MAHALIWSPPLRVWWNQR